MKYTRKLRIRLVVVEDVVNVLPGKGNLAVVFLVHLTHTIEYAVLIGPCDVEGQPCCNSSDDDILLLGHGSPQILAKKESPFSGPAFRRRRWCSRGRGWSRPAWPGT